MISHFEDFRFLYKFNSNKIPIEGLLNHCYHIYILVRNFYFIEGQLTAKVCTPTCSIQLMKKKKRKAICKYLEFLLGLLFYPWCLVIDYQPILKSWHTLRVTCFAIFCLDICNPICCLYWWSLAYACTPLFW